MADHVELFIVGWGLKIRSYGFKVRFARPGSTSRQSRAPLTKLTFAQGVGCVDEVQFMHDLRTLDQTAKPSTLRFSSSSEIEHHRDPLRQEGANVGRERVLQSGIALHKFRNAGDLAGIQRSQPIVLHEKKGAFPLGQLSGESGFSCRQVADLGGIGRLKPTNRRSCCKSLPRLLQ
jgi:hypothetical protein